jgi:hypothetical protein
MVALVSQADGTIRGSDRWAVGRTKMSQQCTAPTHNCKWTSSEAPGCSKDTVHTDACSMPSWSHSPMQNLLTA